MAPPSTEIPWLEPVSDHWLNAESSPEDRFIEKESVSLAFLFTLRKLPPRQRAGLILVDVLDWRPGEIAELLELTVSSVNSVLHRARTTIEASGLSCSDLPKKVDDATQDLLDRYVRAWDARDVGALVALLKDDAAFSMPPTPTWYQGREAIAAFFQDRIFANQGGGGWRLVSTRANRQPAFGIDQIRGTMPPQAFSLQVLTLNEHKDQIAGIISFLNPDLFRRFEFQVDP